MISEAPGIAQMYAGQLATEVIEMIVAVENRLHVPCCHQCCEKSRVHCRGAYPFLPHTGGVCRVKACVLGQWNVEKGKPRGSTLLRLRLAAVDFLNFNNNLSRFKQYRVSEHLLFRVD